MTELLRAPTPRTVHDRQRYRSVLIVSIALLGIFLAVVAADAWRAEYARQIQLQASRIGGVGARVAEIADIARARVIALRHTTALTYATVSGEDGGDVPMPRPGIYTQAIAMPRTAAEQAIVGTILAHPVSLVSPSSHIAEAWRQDYRAFRALWLAQAGLHAASRHVALSYIVSARTGATANFPALTPAALALMIDPNRPRPRTPQDTPFLRMLSPAALPRRGLIWLPVYYDPTGGSTRIDAATKGDGRVISLIAPVDVNGQYRAGVGVDIWAEEMAWILRGNPTPGAELTLVDGAGLVVATTGSDANRLKAGKLGQTAQATDAAGLLQVAPSILRAHGLVRTGGRLFYLWPVPDTPFRLVGRLDPVQLRNATLLGVGPLIGGATILYLLLCLALWYVTRRVFEPAFALAEHIQSLGIDPAPRLPRYWARVLAVTQSAFAERQRFEEELAQQREALHQSEKMTALGTLLAGVAHELNNPLAVVVGRSAILAEALEGSPYARGVAKLRDAADRCSRIVKTFLAMARQSGPRRMTVDINELVEGALDVTGYGLRTAGVTVACDLDPDLPLTHADGDQIVQIFINLIVNAQHALAAEEAAERRLAITTRHDAKAESIRVTVADNGPGIPPAIASRIFDPFFTTKQVGQGTGMGLAVSRGMAEAQGGTLELLSAAKGATFRLSLPIARPTTEADPSSLSVDAPVPPNLRALVIDDEADVAELIRDSLQGLFVAIDLHRDGNRALAAIGAHRYDLVICDLRMPQMHGSDLYARAVQIDSRLADAFLFISGDVLYRDELRRSPAANLPVLEKPFGPAELRAFVRNFLSGAATAPETIETE